MKRLQMGDFDNIIRDPFSVLDNHTVVRVQTLDYISFVKLSYESWVLFIHRFNTHYYHNYSFPATFIQDFKNTCTVTWLDVLLVILMAVAWTFLRTFVTDKYFIPWANSLGLAPVNTRKFPESAFKLCYYAAAWSYCVYVMIISGRYETFWNPVGIWDVWYVGMPVNLDLYILYVVQCSFYMHSVYATFFMDAWRKDSYVMVLHHFLTMALIGFSYAAGHTQEGALVLLLHDVTDIELEFTKLNMYMRKRRGKFFKFNDMLANVGFAFFGLSWFLFRLYWYPLKVMYAALYGALHIADQTAPFIPFFNLMLYLLLFMNIYWFHFILLLVFRIITGKEVEDTRELENGEDEFGEDKGAAPQTNGNGPTLNKSQSERTNSDENLRQRKTNDANGKVT